MTTKLEAARAVAAQLYRAEDAVDAAIRETAKMALAVADARGELNLAAVVGAEVFERTAALHAGLAAARGEAVALHAALADVRDRLRIRMDGPDFGSPNKPPPPSFASAVDSREPSEPRRLRTV